jgi:hypothetical protein
MLTGYKNIDETKYIETQGVWHHFHFHSRMAALSKSDLQALLTETLDELRLFIEDTDYLFITLGTSIAYQLADEEVWVNNCHKQPSQFFAKKDISVEIGTQCMQESLERLCVINPKLQIAFTLSPVRHIKDGLQENARSKARCLLMIDNLIHKLGSKSAYFPAYEWMIDDLRDYRYYADDLIHPSNKALQFIWERFSEHCMDPETLTICQEIGQIRASLLHRPFNTDTDAHVLFLEKLRARQRKIEERLHHIVW